MAITITKRIDSPEQTVELGAKIGARLVGGECIEFMSDLGGGKTTMTTGIVSGAGSDDSVSSPSFTIGKQYTAGELKIYHYDFYRVAEAGLVAEELSEALDLDKSVIIVEWAETVKAVLPEERIRITIKRTADNPDARLFELSVPESMSYVVEEIEV